MKVSGGRDIAPAINALLDLPFTVKVGTKDWHPKDHVSFHTSHVSPNIRPFISKVPIVNPHKPSEAREIPIWPVHCVQGTKGAEIIPEINAAKFNHIVEKGRDKSVEMFSVFADAFGNKDENEASSHNVAQLLNDAGVKQVFVVGLAGDYCVLHTALDAKKEGFQVFVVQDAVKSVDSAKGWIAARDRLQEAGVDVVSMDSAELRKISG